MQNSSVLTRTMLITSTVFCGNYVMGIERASLGTGIR